jgi:transposase-like protein
MSKGKKHTPEQIVAKLRQSEKMKAEGATVAMIVKKLGITEQTLHRWRHQFGTMSKDEAAQLKLLQQENAQLKKIVANQALDIQMLKDVSAGKF